MEKDQVLSKTIFLPSFFLSSPLQQERMEEKQPNAYLWKAFYQTFQSLEENGGDLPMEIWKESKTQWGEKVKERVNTTTTAAKQRGEKKVKMALLAAANTKTSWKSNRKRNRFWPLVRWKKLCFSQSLSRRISPFLLQFFTHLTLRRPIRKSLFLLLLPRTWSRKSFSTILFLG